MGVGSRDGIQGMGLWGWDNGDEILGVGSRGWDRGDGIQGMGSWGQRDPEDGILGITGVG